jgi:hypothetical protein
MNNHQKAQISLVLSVLSYGARAFVLIYCQLLVFFSLSEVTMALIKSVSFKVDFFIFVKPMLIILPSLLSVAVPYVFLITIFLVIRKLKNDNFFKFTAIYPVLMRYLFGAGLLVSVCLSGVIYSLQDNVLEKFDRYIEEEIRNIKSRPIATVLEPLSFNYFGDYVFYLPTIPDASKPYEPVWGHIYKIDFRRISFIGRGYLVRNKFGNIYFKNVYGIELNIRGDLRKKVSKKSVPVFQEELNRSHLNKYVAYYKNFFSKPNIPLSARGYKINYPYVKQLERIIKLQKYFFMLSPAVILLLFFLVFYSFKKPIFQSQNHLFYIGLAFIWSLFFLVSAMLIEVTYKREPTFLRFYINFVFLFCLLFLIKTKNIVRKIKGIYRYSLA